MNIGKIFWKQRKPMTDSLGLLERSDGNLLVYIPVYIYAPMLPRDFTGKWFYVKHITERLEDLIQKVYKPEGGNIYIKTDDCYFDYTVTQDIDPTTLILNGYHTAIGINIHRCKTL